MRGRCAGPWCAWITTPFCLHLGPNQVAHDSVSQSYSKDHWKGLKPMPRMARRDKIGCDLEGGICAAWSCFERAAGFHVVWTLAVVEPEKCLECCFPGGGGLKLASMKIKFLYGTRYNWASSHVNYVTPCCCIMYDRLCTSWHNGTLEPHIELVQFWLLS